MRHKIIVFLLLVSPLTLFAQTGYVQEGKASFYADKFEGRTTASGERYSHSKSTCAHLTLPFGTLVRVTNTSNNQSVVVRVNDRGPFVPNRIIDLSKSAAEKLGFIKEGIADVRIEAIDSEGNSVTQPSSNLQPKPKVVNPSPQPEKPVAQPSKPQQKPVATASVTKPVQSEQSQVNTEVEIYDLKVSRQKAGGFSVQIGSYKELANLLRIADDLRSSLNKEVKVQVATINDEKVYRLMLGDFKSRSEAEAFQPKAAKLYPDCFIVEVK
jgi:rare lipoprotein A